MASMISMATSVDEFLEVGEGDTISEFGPELEVVDLPGHSEGLIGLFRREDGVLLCSDHLLPDIVPNPEIYFAAGRRPRSGLSDWVRSTRRSWVFRCVGFFLVMGRLLAGPKTESKRS